ncbi:galanin receptor 2a-like [Diadema setosum]|uniref:galanin receptor 2a-like n=1 Tax=Diadema setosum TaxID=31175 RepID=UPI003B3B5CA0
MATFTMEEVHTESYEYEIIDSDNHNSTEMVVQWSWGRMEWSWNAIFQLMSTILGVCGNLLVIIVILRRHSGIRSTDILVGNLAIADLLTSLFWVPHPPAEVVPDTWAGIAYCKVWHGYYPMWTSVTASIYTLVAISFDRLYAVLYPMRFYRSVRRKRVVTVVIVLWIGSAIFSSSTLYTITVDGETMKCVFSSSPHAQVVLGIVTFTIRLAFPTTILFTTQIAIARSLRRAALIAPKETLREKAATSFHSVARRRIINLMLIVVVVYVTCWGPNQLAFVAFNLGIIPATYLYSRVHWVFITLALCNSWVNPFIYTLRHQRFRKALQELFTGRSTNTPIFGDLASPEI